MKAMFRIRGGRWSAVVSKVEPGTFGDPELDLQIKIFCGRVQIMCFGFCPEQKRTADTSDRSTVLDYVDLFEFSLSDVDIGDLLHLVSGHPLPVPSRRRNDSAVVRAARLPALRQTEDAA